MAALTYQSQLTAATAANTSERMDQYVHTLAQQQEQLQQTQHQLMVQLAALTLNHGKGRGVGRQRHPNIPPPPPFAPAQLGRHNYGHRGGQGCGRGRGPLVFPGGHTPPPMFINTGRNTSTAPHTPGGRGYFTSTAPHTSGGRGHFTSTAPYTPGGRGYFAPMHQAHINAPYSNTTKRYANWNACFLCGFDVEDNHTSQKCPLHLRQHNHDINFTCYNAQQYINAGYRCCT